MLRRWRRCCRTSRLMLQGWTPSARAVLHRTCCCPSLSAYPQPLLPASPPSTPPGTVPHRPSLKSIIGFQMRMRHSILTERTLVRKREGGNLVFGVVVVRRLV